jgi:flagellar hook assembly protein FlgD
LSFHAPSEGAVSIEVFDAAGRLVREVLRGSTLSAAEIFWDGRDSSGRPVPAGLYFVRAQSGGASVTNRVAVLR